MCMAGDRDSLPDKNALEESGVPTFSEAEGTLASTLTPAGGESSGSDTQPSKILGTGLPALSKKLVSRILNNEYIDFAELPPAKGKSRMLPHSLEGQVIVVQAANLLQTRKIIPDLATWVQCFSLYVAAIASHQLGRVPDLMAYQTLIAKASMKYKWPAWVVYDQNFRQEVAGNPGQAWGRADPSIYAQCFTGQALSGENWCNKCQSLDHTSSNCPARPRKRAWEWTEAASSNLVARADSHDNASVASSVLIMLNI